MIIVISCSAATGFICVSPLAVVIMLWPAALQLAESAQVCAANYRLHQLHGSYTVSPPAENKLHDISEALSCTAVALLVL